MTGVSASHTTPPSGTTPHDEPVDLRSFLDRLRSSGQLTVIDETVDPDGQVGAALSLTEAGGALQFSSVAGSDLSIVGNVASTRERLAAALGVAPSGIAAALAHAIDHPVPVAVHPTGPCRQVRVDGGLAGLPIPTFFRRETGAYVTAGVVMARDVVTGRGNLSFARLKVIDDRHALLGVSPRHHLSRLIDRAGEQGRELPFAVAIGTHPAIMLAACLYLGFGDDELECAGALLGRPVDAVRVGPARIAVPRDAEVIIEGVARADRRVEEGPVSEYHGHYHDYGPGYLVEIGTVTRRPDALLQVIVPGLHGEHLVLGAVAIAAGLQHQLRAVSSAVVEVAVPLPAAGRVAAVVSVGRLRPGEGMRLIMATLAAVPLVKEVTLIDAPLDPWNSEAVAWARTFRMRPERDLHVFPPSSSDRSDPLVGTGAIAKIGIDATARDGDRDVGWELAAADPSALRAARGLLARAGVPVDRSPLVRAVMGVAEGV